MIWLLGWTSEFKEQEFWDLLTSYLIVPFSNANQTNNQNNCKDNMTRYWKILKELSLNWDCESSRHSLHYVLVWMSLHYVLVWMSRPRNHKTEKAFYMRNNANTTFWLFLVNFRTMSLSSVIIGFIFRVANLENQSIESFSKLVATGRLVGSIPVSWFEGQLTWQLNIKCFCFSFKIQEL